jgi:hypothetical protein
MSSEFDRLGDRGSEFYSRRKKEEGRRKKEEAAIAMVSAIKNVLTVLAVGIHGNSYPAVN